MNSRSISVWLSALAAASLALSGCGQPTTPAAPSGPTASKVGVVTSTNVYGAVASAVAGDLATITSIIKSPDADPHEYEATPSDALAVNEAKVVVVNGSGYDDFAGKLVEASGSKPTVIDVSELSGLKAAVPAGEEFNEHVWYNLDAVAKLADQLATELGKAEPAAAATFTSNAAAFKTKLDGLAAKLGAIKTAHAGARVSITEPVPVYLIEAAGLENATPEEFSEAIELGKDPSAAVLNETLDLFRTGSVKALLANTQTENGSTKQIEQAAAAAGVPTVDVTETLPSGVTDYVSWIGGEIDQLAAALDRR